MGDRGDFEVPDDIYRGGGYRPPVQRGEGFIGLDEFKAETPQARMGVYGSLAMAFIAAPDSLSNDELLLLGYGMLVDASTPDMKPVLQEFPEFNTLFDDTHAALSEMPNAGRAGSAMSTVFSWDRAVPERLQIPVTTLVVLAAMKGAIAAPVVGPVVTGTIQKLPLLSKFTGGSMAATAGAFKAVILATAARIAGKPALVKVLKFTGKGIVIGTGATLGLGLGGDVLSAASEFINPGSNQTQEELQAIEAEADLQYTASTQPQGGPQGGQLPTPPGSPPTGAPTGFTQTPEDFPTQVTPGPVPPGSPLDPNLDLASQIAGWNEAVNRDDPLIRVSADFPDRREMQGLTGRREWEREALASGYRSSDVQETLANLSVGQLIHMQNLAVRAGLLTQPEGGLPNFLPGSRDNATEAALAIFMGQANIDRRISWWNSAGEMANIGDAARAKADAEDAANRPRYVSKPFFKLDPASIRQAVDRQMERELGRPINDWEWTTFLNEWQQNNRKQYEQSEAGDRSYFEAQYREGQSHTAQAAGTFQQIDPQARFDDQFQTMFKGELSRKKRTEQVQGMTGNLMAALGTAEAAVRR